MDDLSTQSRERLTALLALVEKDESSIHSAAPPIAESGTDVYRRFIDAVHRGLDNLDAEVDEGHRL